MAYRLVIVEDEDGMREGLTKYVPWDEYGFEVVQTFEDGDEALRWLDDHTCDVILSDVVMGRMDGLELAEHVNKRHPEIAFVILSGYNRFEYARKAIQNQVVDYLLKPLDNQELARVFQRLRSTLDERVKQNGVVYELNIEKEEVISLLRSSFFQLLLMGHIVSQTQMNMYLRLLKIPKTIVQRPLLAYEISAPESEETDLQENASIDPDEAYAQLRSYFSRIQSSDQDALYEVIRLPNGNVRVIIAAVSDISLDRMQHRFKNEMDAFQKTLAQPYQDAVSCTLTNIVLSVSELCPGISKLHSSDVKNVSEDDNELCVRLLSYASILIVELDLDHPKDILRILSKIMLQLRNASIEQTRFVLNNLLTAIEIEYAHRELDVKLLTAGAFDAANFLHVSELDACAELLEKSFLALCDALRALYQAFQVDRVGRIIQYVLNHLSSDLSREEMAATLHFHPVSISRIFRQKTGESLSAFILRVKMETAIDMLKDKERTIRDICDKLGYRSSSYFINTFKKYTGFSPKDYYNRMLL